jgi:hypothetical protein
MHVFPFSNISLFLLFQSCDMGACGSKVLWETAGHDPMDDLRKRGKEIGFYRDAPEQKDQNDMTGDVSRCHDI